MISSAAFRFEIPEQACCKCGRNFKSAALVLQRTNDIMADHIVPHFHNDLGVPVIEVGAKEFMCVGERPPFDHPHIFLDMGDESEIICSYCSTLYRHDPSLAPHASRPPECALRSAA